MKGELCQTSIEDLSHEMLLKQFDGTLQLAAFTAELG